MTRDDAADASVPVGRVCQILEISVYPPPPAGWAVRVEFLKKRLEAEGHKCVVLNLGHARKIPSPEYETVLNGLDYLRKVWRYSRQGYVAHVHLNGTSVKGFVLTFIAEVVNLCWGRRCFMTFHAGVDQIYFPRPKYPWLLPVFWVLFTIPKRIVCNSEAVKQKIQEYGVGEDKIAAIPAFSEQYLEYRAAPLSPEVEAYYQRFAHPLFTYIRIRHGFYLDTLIEGVARLVVRDPEVCLILCGVAGDIDQRLWTDLQERIGRHHLEHRICVIDQLSRAEFLTALHRSRIYVRTPTSDGVCSSVLEALSLGVPVVAAENGTRPVGVITYSATDPDDLANVVSEVLAKRDAIAAALPRPALRDTLGDEVHLLTS